MSVIFRGDGTYTSSIAITTLTFDRDPIRPASRQKIYNRELLEGDGGYSILYNKGKDSGVFNLVFTLADKSLLGQILNFERELNYGKNWFLFQPSFIYYKPIFTQAYTGGSTVYIQNSNLGLYDDLRLEVGARVFVLSGSAIGQSRLILWADSNYVLRTDPFANTVAVGDNCIVGYPVILNDSIKSECDRAPNYYRTGINLREFNI